jgi:DNA repair exonuclease SbcCD ATPase subunit
MLQEELTRKNANLQRLKSQKEETKSAHMKGDNESLQSEIKHLKEQLAKLREENEKIRRKKDRELQEVQAQLDKAKKEFSIERSSLESSIRVLADTLSGVYCSLDIMARKKGSIQGSPPNFNQLVSNPLAIRSTQIH